MRKYQTEFKLKVGVGHFRQHEVDVGTRDGISSDKRARIKELERENKELRKANVILMLASAFAQAELDRRLKS